MSGLIKSFASLMVMPDRFNGGLSMRLIAMFTSHVIHSRQQQQQQQRRRNVVIRICLQDVPVPVLNANPPPSPASKERKRFSIHMHQHNLNTAAWPRLANLIFFSSIHFSFRVFRGWFFFSMNFTTIYYIGRPGPIGNHFVIWNWTHLMSNSVNVDSIGAAGAHHRLAQTHTRTPLDISCPLKWRFTFGWTHPIQSSGCENPHILTTEMSIDW